MLKTSLRYFLAVAACGSIRLASSELNVAQSAISRQIQALEYELGVELLDRHSRGVALTEAGKLLFRYAKSAALDVDLLQSELDELAGLERGHVRVAAIESMVPYILPRSLSTFKAMHPRITHRVTITKTDEIVDLVHNGLVDFGVALSPTIGPEISVLYERVEYLIAVVSPDHPLAGEKAISIAQAAKYPMAMSMPRSEARVVIDRACRKADVIVTPVLESNSVELLHHMAVAGECIAPLLPHTVLRSIHRGSARIIPFSDPSIACSLSIITLAGRTLPPAAAKLAAVISGQLEGDQSAEGKATPD